MTELMAVEIARIQRNIHFEEYWKETIIAYRRS